MKDSEISRYLSRINVVDCKADLAGLSLLQEQHMENIPFENLDIVVGREIALDQEHLFNKLIVQKRGGYCFELNLLYVDLLRSFGFSAQAVLGRVWISNPKSLPPRNHLAHLVKLDGRTYVTDVGFGGLITSMPLDIHVSSPVADKDGLVRITPFAGDQFMIQRKTEKGWMNQYSFEQEEISEEDISISNYYMSTHPNSHFFQHKFAGKNTKDGRIGLFNNKMTIRKGIKVVDGRRVEFGEDWIETIKDQFSIDLDFTALELKALFGEKSIG